MVSVAWAPINGIMYRVYGAATKASQTAQRHAPSVHTLASKLAVYIATFGLSTTSMQSDRESHARRELVPSPGCGYKGRVDNLARHKRRVHLSGTGVNGDD